jgi:hypothetical protein
VSTPIRISDDFRALLGKHIRGRAHGGVPFEGKLIAIATSPQAIVEDKDGNRHNYTIETITDLEVQGWEPIR